MKTAGIVADNYKVDKFKEELIKNGYNNFKVTPFTKDTTTIKVTVEDDKVKEIYKICQLVEMHFKRSN